jgi:hypothetical protein
MLGQFTVGSAVLQMVRKENLYGKNVHTVKLISGEWPEREDLITACDNYPYVEDKDSHHFGGSVDIYTDGTAKVTVYID